MVSSNLRMAQFAAVKQFGDDGPSSIIDHSDLTDDNRLFSKKAAIALKGRSLTIVLNFLVDSFLLLNSEGNVLLSNAKADQLLQKMQPRPAKMTKSSQACLPDAVLRACRLLLENRNLLADQSLPPQVVLTVRPDIQLRISLLKTESESESESEELMFLVAMEDKRQSSLTQATVDQWLFGLTNREKEVWELRLQDYAYQDIADELYLSVNTVKRHMKAILAKQEQWRYDTFELLAS